MKVKRPHRLKIIFGIIAAGLLLVWSFVPTLLLGQLLDKAMKARGWQGSFGDVSLGFFLTSLETENLNLTLPQEGLNVKAEFLSLQGLSPLKIWSLVNDGPPAGGLILAKDLKLNKLEVQALADQKSAIAPFSLDNLNVKRLALPQMDADPGFSPLELDHLILKGFRYGVTKNQNLRLGLKYLELRELHGASLSFFKLENFSGSWPDQEKEALILNLGSLSLVGLNLEKALTPVLDGEYALLPLQLFTALESLELIDLSARRQDNLALKINSAFFDHQEGAETFDYVRKFDLFLDLNYLYPRWQRNLSAALRPVFELNDGRLKADFNFLSSVNFDKKEVNVKDSFCSFDGLGKLYFNSALYDWPEEGDFNMATFSQVSLGTSSVIYQDRGLAAKFYPYLNKTTFKGASGQKAEQLLQDMTKPLFLSLEKNGSLSNLGALEAEVRAFLKEPQNLIVFMSPEKPVPLAPLLFNVFNKNKYYALKDLVLGLKVNQRAPVYLGFQASAKDEPRPLDDVFDSNRLKNSN